MKKIRVYSIDGDAEYFGYFIKENDTGFWCFLSETTNVPFKFPWKHFKYEIIKEEK